LTLHSRDAEGKWVARVAISGGKIALSSLSAELFVDEIYRSSAIA